MSGSRLIRIVFMMTVGLCVCAPGNSARAVQVTSVWLGGNGNWNTPLAWSTGVVPNNNAATTFDVRIDGGNPLASTVSLNLSPTVDKLTIDAGETLMILNGQGLHVVGGPAAGSIANAGTLQLQATTSTTDLMGSGGDLSLTGGGTIVMGNHANNRLYQSTSGTLTNVDNTIRGAGQIGVNGRPIVNQGTIIADQSIALTLDPGTTITNSGTLRAQAGATMRLITGTFPNAGGVIEALDAAVVEVNSATVQGGTIHTAGSGEIRSVNSTFEGVSNAITNTGDLIVPNGANATFTGALVNRGAVRLNGSTTTTDLIGTGGDVTLSGGGTIALSNSANNRIYQSGTGTLTNVNNTIRGAGQIGLNQSPIVNQALIVADQTAALSLDPGTTLTNAGTLRAESGATLRLINGSFPNTGGVIEALDASTVEVTSATVSGGTLRTEGTGEIHCENSTLNGAPDPIALNGQMVVPNGNSASLVGTLVNGGTIRMDSTTTTTDLIGTGGDVTLSGGGTIALSNSANNRIFQSGTGTLTNVNNTIRGAGQIGVNQSPIVNQALIVADQTAALSLDPGTTLTNLGTLRAESGATLRLINGSFSNTGGVIEALDGSVVEVITATITGGTLRTQGAGEIHSENSTFNGATDPIALNGQMVVPNGNSASLVGTLVNGGTIRMDSTTTTTDLIGTGGDVTLSGGGTIVMSNRPNNRIFQSGTGTLTNVNNTIRGAGQIGANQSPIVNQGTIIADQTTALTIDPGSGVGVVNQGVMTVSGAGGLTLAAGTFTTSGAVTIDATRVLTRSGAYDQTGGATTVDGTLSASGMNIQGGTLTGGGTVAGGVVNSGTVAPGKSIGTLTCTGEYTQSATGILDIELAGVEPGTGYDRLVVSGAATLGGTLRVTVVDPFVPQVGDAFVVMTYASRTGGFAAYDATCLHSSGKRLRVYDGPTSLTVSIVSASGDLTDMNCDCVSDAEDLAAFLLALTNPAAYATAYPACDILNGDINGDSLVNGADIQGFTDRTVAP